MRSTRATASAMVSRAVAASPDLAASFASTPSASDPSTCVAVLGGERRRFSSVLVPPHRVAPLPQERREVRPDVAELAQRSRGFLDEVASVLRLAGEHLEVECDLDGAEVGQRLAGIPIEGPVPVHRRTRGVELAEPSAEVRERMAHERVDLSAPRVRLDRPLGASDALGDGGGPPDERRGEVPESLVLLVPGGSAPGVFQGALHRIELRPPLS